MLVIFFLFSTCVRLILSDFFIFSLHSKADNLFLCVITEYIEQIYYGHVTFRSFGERILHPTVGFAADINEDVASCNFHNVFRSGLIAVKVNTVAEKQGRFNILRRILHDLPYPVILWKNRSHNADG